jgi:DNA-binding NarL/FixJ family response regulator
MPGLSGLDLVQQVRQDKPSLRVLVLSVHPEEQYAVRVMKASASGYLTKDSAPEDLISAVRLIAAGHKYVTATLAQRLALELDSSNDRMPHQYLSDREYQVMLLLAEGLKVTEIAERLLLSVKTVSTYHTRLLHKMNMRSNAELVRYAVRHGLVEA